jgi:ribose transport system permease protein
MASVSQPVPTGMAEAAARLRAPFARTSYAWPALIATVLLIVVTEAVNPGFLAASNLGPVAVVLTPFVLISMAQALPIVSGHGGLDLSVGPLAGFVTVLVAATLEPAHITNVVPVLAIVLGIGVFAGAVNGVLIAYVRIPPVIVTLGSYLVLSGLATQVLPSPGGSVPSWLSGLAGTAAGIPLMIIPVALVIAFWLWLKSTSFLRNLLVMGGDERCAFSAGINTELLRVCVYMISGLIAVVAGIALAASLGSGDATVGANYSLISFAGAALGGISLAGGRGGMLGAAAGGCILFLVQNLLTLANVSVFQQQIAEGLLLVFALAANSMGLKLRLRRRED